MWAEVVIRVREADGKHLLPQAPGLHINIIRFLTNKYWFWKSVYILLKHCLFGSDEKPVCKAIKSQNTSKTTQLLSRCASFCYGKTSLSWEHTTSYAGFCSLRLPCEEIKLKNRLPWLRLETFFQVPKQTQTQKKTIWVDSELRASKIWQWEINNIAWSMKYSFWN